jgi:hypothetical protein
MSDRRRRAGAADEMDVISSGFFRISPDPDSHFSRQGIRRADPSRHMGRHYRDVPMPMLPFGFFYFKR